MLWLHASSSERLEQSVRDTVDQLKITGGGTSNTNVFQLFRSWLRDPRHGKWLLILDNVDDEHVLLEPPSCSEQRRGLDRQKQSRERCLDYLPPSGHGSILVTSRSQDVALKIVDRKALVAVDPMDEEYAVQLVETKLERPHSKEDAVELVQALDCMPLAITQAAAYIDRSPSCSVTRYLERLQTSDRSWHNLLQHDALDLRRDKDAKHSILLTWQISFDRIFETRRSAANLLSLMCMFDSQSIPASALDDWSEPRRLIRRKIDSWIRKTILRQGKRNEPKGSGIRTGIARIEDTTFEEDFRTLLNYSLISINAGMSTFKMHRLVQLATQAWLESRGQLEQWRFKFLSNLDHAFPNSTRDVEHLERCRPLYPSAVAALRLEPRRRDARLRQAALLIKSGRFANDIGDLANAVNMLTRSWSLRAFLLRDGHDCTLNSLWHLVYMYQQQDRLEEAEELQAKHLEITKRIHGDEHERTLISKFDLAEIYFEQRRLEEAEELQTKTLCIATQKLGHDHCKTIDGAHCLAKTYEHQGKLEEAEALHARALYTRKLLLGDQDPDTIGSMIYLATLYYSLGRLHEAAELHLQVLRVKTQTLGATHLETLNSVFHLAKTYEKQGCLQKSEELHRQTLYARKRLLGIKHPSTLISMNSLACVLQRIGRRRSSRELFELCAAISDDVLGPSHPDTIYRAYFQKSWMQDRANESGKMGANDSTIRNDADDRSKTS